MPVTRKREHQLSWGKRCSEWEIPAAIHQRSRRGTEDEQCLYSRFCRRCRCTCALERTNHCAWIKVQRHSVFKGAGVDRRKTELFPLLPTFDTGQLIIRESFLQLRLPWLEASEAVLFRLSWKVRTAVGRDVRHGFESGGGLFPLDGQTISLLSV